MWVEKQKCPSCTVLFRDIRSWKHLITSILGNFAWRKHALWVQKSRLPLLSVILIKDYKTFTSEPKAHNFNHLQVNVNRLQFSQQNLMFSDSIKTIRSKVLRIYEISILKHYLHQLWNTTKCFKTFLPCQKDQFIFTDVWLFPLPFINIDKK